MVDEGKHPDPLSPKDPQLCSVAASQQPQRSSFPNRLCFPTSFPFTLSVSLPWTCVVTICCYSKRLAFICTNVRTESIHPTILSSDRFVPGGIGKQLIGQSLLLRCSLPDGSMRRSGFLSTGQHSQPGHLGDTRVDGHVRNGNLYCMYIKRG